VSGVELLPLNGLAEIVPGDSLGSVILHALARQNLALKDGDIVVVTQKIVSKSEGCVVELDSVQPSQLATEWAERWAKDPRVTEVVLRESQRILRMERGVIISETRHGFICANAGVDCSNVGHAGQATLLPRDPDASAERIRATLMAHSGVRLGVVISDTFGRPWREGQTNVAVGSAGVEPMHSYEGEVDPTGYQLRVTAPAFIDEVAAAAGLVMGKLDRVPAAIVRGLGHALGEGVARDLVRPAAMDLFR
jgi:coenzyme F420-0:L-glutamate ligase / coenzyme F420-1:gamma-L-glutamate ligase